MVADKKGKPKQSPFHIKVGMKKESDGRNCRTQNQK